MKDSDLLKNLFLVQTTPEKPLTAHLPEVKQTIDKLTEYEPMGYVPDRTKNKARKADEQTRIQLAVHHLLTGDGYHKISEKFHIAESVVREAIEERIGGPNAAVLANQANLFQSVLFAKIMLILGSVDPEAIGKALEQGKLKDVIAAATQMYEMSEKVNELQTGRGWDKDYTPTSVDAMLDDLKVSIGPMIKLLQRADAARKHGQSYPTEGLSVEQK